MSAIFICAQSQVYSNLWRQTCESLAYATWKIFTYWVFQFSPEAFFHGWISTEFDTFSSDTLSTTGTHPTWSNRLCPHIPSRLPLFVSLLPPYIKRREAGGCGTCFREGSFTAEVVLLLCCCVELLAAHPRLRGRLAANKRFPVNDALLTNTKDPNQALQPEQYPLSPSISLSLSVCVLSCNGLKI